MSKTLTDIPLEYKLRIHIFLDNVNAAAETGLHFYAYNGSDHLLHIAFSDDDIYLGDIDGNMTKISTTDHNFENIWRYVDLHVKDGFVDIYIDDILEYTGKSLSAETENENQIWVVQSSNSSTGRYSYVDTIKLTEYTPYKS